MTMRGLFGDTYTSSGSGGGGGDRNKQLQPCRCEVDVISPLSLCVCARCESHKTLYSSLQIKYRKSQQRDHGIALSSRICANEKVNRCRHHLEVMTTV
jgi:hypothetical protein